MNDETPNPCSPPVSLPAGHWADELSKRPHRSADAIAENRVLTALVQDLATAPETALQRVAEAALELCGAGSAGVSILEPGSNPEMICWRAAAGKFAVHAGHCVARSASPCGAALDHRGALLVSEPARHFDLGIPLAAPIVEALLVPFPGEGALTGAVWVLHHTAEARFDPEDRRLLTTLSHLAATAWRLTAGPTVPHSTSSDRVSAGLASETVSNAEDDRLRQFIDQAPLALAMLDRELRYLAVSRRWVTDHRLEGTEFIGRTLYDTFPELPERWKEPHRRALAGETISSAEEQFVRADGTTQWVAATLLPWRTSVGSIGGIIVAVEEITARKQAEARLVADLEVMTRLHHLGTLFIRENQIEHLLNEVLDAAIEIAEADFGDIQLLDTETGDLQIAAPCGFPQWWVDFWNSAGKGHGSCGAALTAGARVIVEDVETSLVFAASDALEMQRRAGVRAVQSTPLVSRGGRLLGMFSTHYRRPYRPDERALRLLDLLAQQAADMLERVEHEQELRKSERRARDSQARLKAALESMPDAILIVDSSGQIIDFNQGFVTFHRLKSREEVFAKQSDVAGFLEITEPDGTPSAPQNWPLMRALRGETGSDVEFHVRRKDTGETWISSFTFSPIRDPEGTIVGAVVVGRDITARHQYVEAELRRRETWLRSVLDTATDAIITIDRQGCILSANPATEPMFGYAVSELIGQPISRLMPPPFRDEHDGYIERYLSTGERRVIGHRREAIARRRDGTIFPVELAVNQIDRELKFTGFIRDITERKQFQRRVLDAVAEEQRRIGMELHDGIQQELTGLSLFASLAAQSIKQLAAPPENPSLPEADAAGTPRGLAWKNLQDAISRLTKELPETHRHVKELSRGIVPVLIDSEGLRAALESLAQGVRPQVRCEFVHSGDVDIADIAVASHLYRIAQEALTNALNHARASEIKISLTAVNGNLVLEVLDDGDGFDRTQIAGGMGLRSMEYRASLIGGVLRVERAQPRGTSVCCTFPRPGETESFLDWARH